MAKSIGPEDGSRVIGETVCRIGVPCMVYASQGTANRKCKTVDSKHYGLLVLPAPLDN
jgi:hypothetical protein